MKARNPSTGNLETVYVKALDSMPVGTIVDYDGQASDIPTGWETYGQNQIKKTSETRALAGNIVNAYSESQNSAYSTEYANNVFGGTILYNNTSGTTSNFSLDDSVVNYKRVDIKYKTNDGNEGVKVVYNNNANFKTELNELYTSSSTGATLYVKAGQLSFNGSSVTYSNKYEIAITANSFQWNENNTLSIYEVIGYK